MNRDVFSHFSNRSRMPIRDRSNTRIGRCVLHHNSRGPGRPGKAISQNQQVTLLGDLRRITHPVIRSGGLFDRPGLAVTGGVSSSIVQFVSNLPTHFLPNGNHNPGELRQSQLVLPKPGGVCHVESIVLGSSEPTAARTDRSGSCPGLGSRSGPKVQNLCEISRPKP